MAPHSSTLAWKIPWMEEPGRLQSMGSLRVEHNWLHFHFSLSCIGEGNGNPLQCSCLENPGMGEPGGLPSMGSHRVGHDWSDLAAAAIKSSEESMLSSNFREISTYVCMCLWVCGDWVLSKYRELIPYSSHTNCFIINVSQPGVTL